MELLNNHERELLAKYNKYLSNTKTIEPVKYSDIFVGNAQINDQKIQNQKLQIKQSSANKKDQFKNILTELNNVQCRKSIIEETQKQNNECKVAVTTQQSIKLSDRPEKQTRQQSQKDDRAMKKSKQLKESSRISNSQSTIEIQQQFNSKILQQLEKLIELKKIDDKFYTRLIKKHLEECPSFECIELIIMIESIILCEFHDFIGKQAILQYPNEQSINIEILSDFLLPKEELCGKLLMIEYQQDYVINIPMVMRNNQIYGRAIYFFSVAIKVKKEQYQKNQDAYFEIIKKLAYTISQLEANRNLTYYNSENKEEIYNLIKHIYEDINSSHESFVEFDNSQYMFLRLPQPLLTPSNLIIKYSQVPFPIVNIRKGVQTTFNPILEKLIPEINGINCVGAICQKLKPFKAEQVKIAIKEMIEFNLIKMVDMVKQSNIYVINENFYTHQFKEDGIFSIINKEQFENKFGKVENLENLKIILQTMYIELKRNCTLREYVQQHQKQLEYVSLIRLIRYGQINNFLNRVYEYFFICCNIKDQKGQCQLGNIFITPPQNYIKVSERFNEEDKNIKEQQIPLMEGSIEYSRRYEIGVETQLMNQKLKDEEKLKDANETIKNMILNQETLDEICLIFQLDLESCQQQIESQEEYIIIHK